MSLQLKRKEFELPSEGPHDATLTEIKDLGVVPTAFGSKERVRFSWTLDTKGADGKQLMVVQSFNATWNPMSSVWKVYQQITGKQPPSDVNLEKLKGNRCCLYVMHKADKTGKLWANILRLSPIKNGHGLEIDDDDLPPVLGGGK